MTVHALRLPLLLNPLIAEAKRRARRRFVIAVAVFLVTAAGTVATLVASSSSDGRSLQDALVPSVLGAPHNNREGGTRGNFSIVLGLTNGARAPVSLERVHAVVNARSSLRQFATSFRLYKGPPCTLTMAPSGSPGHCSPYPGFPLRPNGGRQPVPLRVAPGREALAQLSFRFAGCMRRAMLESVSIQTMTVVYGLPNGTRIYQHPQLPLAQPVGGTAFGRSTVIAVAAQPGQPASRRLHTVAWVTTNPCHR